MTLDSPIRQHDGRRPVDAATGIVREGAAAILTKAMRQNISATDH
jgi:hypothetical protein